MQETWRWFGPDDTVSLDNVLQAGASGVVTSLDGIPAGDIWPLEAILNRKEYIEAAGLSWSVVESIPVHNDIKTRTGDYLQLIENYKVSVQNVGKAGIRVICYNFMPVVDWTRTNLAYDLPNKSRSLRFEMLDFVAYDVFILKRKDAAQDYSAEMLTLAEIRYLAMSERQQLALEKNIIAGLPGGEGSYDRGKILSAIDVFNQLGTAGLRGNLFHFLSEIIPVAEDAGVKMAIHPDDPPFTLFGLPRVVSTAEDARALLAAVPSVANGLTLCAGSYGARGDNDLVAMAQEFGPSIYFVHLRNVTREPDGSFYEAEHLDGDNDMVGLIRALLGEERRRDASGETLEIAMRPDHGHLMGDEVGRDGINPGYSFGGRMKGLAELRGVIHTLKIVDARKAV